ncbi:MAG: hypothetical protein L6Q38_01910 [Nitrospira sp.]|nr:hypothetical protein [Nitrospira sp.]
MILGSNYQAAGQLGAIPNVFTNCKIKYNSRRYRLKIKAAKGSFSGGLPIVQGTAGLSSIVLVGVFIDRPPYGGVPNQAFGLPMLFQVTVRTDGSGVVSEAGKAAEF